MKKFLSVILLFTSACAIAQDREKEFQLRIGYGLAFYATDLEYSYNDGTFEFTLQDEDSAATSHVPIELRYELHPRFNLGIDMRFGKYLYDKNEDNTGQSNSFSSFGLGLEGVIVSRPKFRWYLGLTLSTTNLEISQTSGTNKETFQWGGGGTRFYTGISWFIADGPVALNFNMGRDARNFDLKDFTSDGAS